VNLNALAIVRLIISSWLTGIVATDIAYELIEIERLAAFRDVCKQHLDERMLAVVRGALLVFRADNSTNYEQRGAARPCLFVSDVEFGI
jgi:hypothetical protein